MCVFIIWCAVTLFLIRIYAAEEGGLTDKKFIQAILWPAYLIKHFVSAGKKHDVTSGDNSDESR